MTSLDSSTNPESFFLEFIMRHGWMSSLVAVGVLGVAVAAVCAAPPIGAASEAVADRIDRRELDRAAILAMAGEYRVEFNFRETVALSPGYGLRAPYIEHATETIVVVENQPEQIVLQHILVLKSDDAPEVRVVKHWRQDWRYEPVETWAFLGDRTWTRRPLLPEETKGKWVQEVYQVDDSPRYASVGTWSHAPDASAVNLVGSSWEGETVARPLPRREFSARTDYQLLTGRNRHTITPTGWVHEQDNTKIVTDAANRLLAREFGQNIYDRLGKGIASTTSIDFSPGYDYWRRTEAFWAEVRAEWNLRLQSPCPIRLVASVDDKPMWSHFFDRASDTPDAESAKDFARGTIDRFVDSNPARNVASR
jgi:hypothetical protein